MIHVRTAESDADLEAWRHVRMVVVPNERAPSVEELRRVGTPDRLLLLAELDGELAGSGYASRSEMTGLGSLAPRVLPEARRRGVGTALLRALTAHVAALGFSEANTTVGDDASMYRAWPFSEVAVAPPDGANTYLFDATYVFHPDLDWVRSVGCSELASDALLENETCHAVHRALGFQETERVAFFRRAL